MGRTRYAHDFQDGTLLEGAASVDRDAGVIRGVKLLGRVSRNNREYTDGALREAAQQYAGAKINIDHPDRRDPSAERKVLDGFGVIESVRVEKDGVYGDIRYLTSHPAASLIAEAAEKMPGAFGFSHNARGRTNKRGGKTVVESIESVRSVDLVRDPATTSGLFESEQHMSTVKAILESSKLPGVEDALASLVEMDGDMAAAPVDAPADAGGDQVAGAFESMVVAVFRDDSLDLSAKVAKIREILKAYDKLAGDGGEADEKPADDSADAGDDAAESVDEIKAELALLKSQNAARKLLESLNRDATELRIKALVSLAESDRKALAESWPESRGQKSKPSRSAPLVESEDELTTDQFVKAILSR